jgi:3-methyl-2-oxobutanoate hydroxymethyltransferase
MDTARKITLSSLVESKRAGRKFSVLTCYDVATARLMQAAGVEVLLVGDTAGEVILGLPTTREIPPEFLLSLTAAVRRGAPEAFVMADLPFACRQQGDPDSTVEWVRRFHEETGSDAVKIEVTGRDALLVEIARDAGVPVVAHLGLLPQRVDPHEGYRAQAKDAASARDLIDDAKRLENAGACMLLLEAVAGEVAREITARTSLPVIGCVSGPGCDGTVVVLHDLLGLGGGHPPRGARQYQNLAEVLGRAFMEYVEDIHQGRFPTEADVPHMKAGEFEKLAGLLGEA